MTSMQLSVPICYLMCTKIHEPRDPLGVKKPTFLRRLGAKDGHDIVPLCDVCISTVAPV